MKKLIVTLGLLAAVTVAYAQGTINFQNSFLQPIKLRIQNTDGTYQTPINVPTAEAVNYGVFAGASAGSLNFIAPVLPSSVTTAGLIAAPTTAFAITGSQPGETTWFVQVRGWSASYGTDWAGAQAAFSTQGGVIWGESAIASGFALGPATGPGYAIWQSATGTNPQKIAAFTLTQSAVIPEPSTLALAGLSLAGLLIFRRRN